MNAHAAILPAFAVSPCGGVAVRIGGAEAVLRASGALWLPAARLLAVADLHLEKGSAYAARGQMLPPYDSRETLARLAAEVAALAPATVVLLGDSLHDDGAEDRLAADDRRVLAQIGARCALVWVRGNHDVDGKGALPGLAADGWEAEGLRFAHEPSAGAGAGVVWGHLHPCAKVRGRAGSVRRRCFVTDGERAVLPAFGAFAGGLNVKDAAFAGLFARRPLVVALGERRAHAVGWGSLGRD